MFPRIAVFISPLRSGTGYRCTVRKGWWGGPGRGGQSAIIAELELELKATSEAERVREALRAIADSLEG